MDELFLSRKQYDSLITSHAAYMASGEYQKLSKSWGIGGVLVKGTSQQIAELKSKLGQLTESRESNDPSPVIESLLRPMSPEDAWLRKWGEPGLRQEAELREGANQTLVSAWSKGISGDDEERVKEAKRWLAELVPLAKSLSQEDAKATIAAMGDRVPPSGYSAKDELAKKFEGRAGGNIRSTLVNR